MYKSVPPDICLNLFFASSEMIPVVYCPLVLVIGKHQWFRSASSLLGLKDHIPLGQTGCYHHGPVQGGDKKHKTFTLSQPPTSPDTSPGFTYFWQTAVGFGRAVAAEAFPGQEQNVDGRQETQRAECYAAALCNVRTNALVTGSVELAWTCGA